MEVKSREPSGRYAALDSPLDERVSWRAGATPAGSSAQSEVTNLAPLPSSWATLATSRSPAGDSVSPPTRGMDM